MSKHYIKMVEEYVTATGSRAIPVQFEKLIEDNVSKSIEELLNEEMPLPITRIQNVRSEDELATRFAWHATHLEPTFKQPRTMVVVNAITWRDLADAVRELRPNDYHAAFGLMPTSIEFKGSTAIIVCAT